MFKIGESSFKKREWKIMSTKLCAKISIEKERINHNMWYILKPYRCVYKCTCSVIWYIPEKNPISSRHWWKRNLSLDNLPSKTGWVCQVGFSFIPAHLQQEALGDSLHVWMWLWFCAVTFGEPQVDEGSDHAWGSPLCMTAMTSLHAEVCSGHILLCLWD